MTASQGASGHLHCIIPLLFINLAYLIWIVPFYILSQARVEGKITKYSKAIERKVMRIAMLVGNFPVLAETAILNQITGLIDRGHEVDIYPLDDSKADTSTIHPDVHKYGLLKRSYFFARIPENSFLYYLKFLSRWFVHWYKNPGKAFRYLKVFQFGNRRKLLEEGYAMLPLLDKKPYDIIHCQFGPLGLRVQEYRHFPLFKEGKLIVSMRGYDMSRYVQVKGQDIYKPIFEQADLFLPVCDYFKQRMIQLGCDEQKIMVHHSGINCQRFTYRTRSFDPGGQVRLITTGRLVEKKGMEYAIRAVAKISQTYPNIVYTIIGDGPLKSELDRLVEELMVTERVHLVGQKHHDEVAEILGKSHIFLAPSVTAVDGNQEGIPNALKEAMAMGLVVLSTRHSGIPELIEEEKTGYLVPERDVDSIAQKLIFIIEHPDQWAQLGRSSRDFVMKHFDMNKLNDELVEIYQQLLK